MRTRPETGGTDGIEHTTPDHPDGWATRSRAVGDQALATGSPPRPGGPRPMAVGPGGAVTAVAGRCAKQLQGRDPKRFHAVAARGNSRR